MTAYVYRMFDTDGQLLYIGCSNNVHSRVGQHMKRAEWASAVCRYTVDIHPTREAALAAESAAILAEQPVHNIRGKRMAGEISAVLVGKTFAMMREAHGLPVERIAALVGVLPGAIVAIERGDYLPTAELYEALVDTFSSLPGRIVDAISELPEKSA